MEKECDIVQFFLSQYLVLTNKWYWIQFMRYTSQWLRNWEGRPCYWGGLRDGLSYLGSLPFYWGPPRLNLLSVKWSIQPKKIFWFHFFKPEDWLKFGKILLKNLFYLKICQNWHDVKIGGMCTQCTLYSSSYFLLFLSV